MTTKNSVSTRYSRQILFKDIGIEGQKRLNRGSVVVVGCGALGSVIAGSLVRAGVGRIKIIDRDFVEESNLQRQMIFDEDDVKSDLPKAVAAERKLRKVNSSVVIDPVVADLNSDNIDELLNGADIVIDGLDNFGARFLINDYCVKSKIPWIYGACVGSVGLSMNIIPGLTPCLRCVFEAIPSPGSSPTCDTSGVIAPIVNIIASIQTAEAFKVLTGNFVQLNRKLISIDVWRVKYDKINIENAKQTGNCPACKEGRFDFLAGGSDSLTASLCGRNAVQIRYRDNKHVNFKKVAQRLECIGDVRFNEYMLKFEIDVYEITLFNDGRSIIFGTNDQITAKNIYAKYIGE